MPKISVITPVYNVEKYLDRCVTSLLNQTFTDFELLLVDDGSTDGSGKLCDLWKERDARIRVFHQENAGQAVARNRAIDNAQGEYIAFVDSDDWVAADFLEILYQNIVDFDADISVCGYFKVSSKDEETEIRKLNLPAVYGGKEFVKECVLSGLNKHWILCDKLFRFSCFDSKRMPVGRVYEDNAIVYKLLYDADKVVNCDVELYYYFQREGSTVSSIKESKVYDYMLMWEEKEEFFLNKSEEALLSKTRESYFMELISVCNILQERKTMPKLLSDIKIKLKKQKKKVSNVSVKTYPQYYEVMYPRRMKLYWTVKGIARKFKHGNS